MRKKVKLRYLLILGLVFFICAYFVQANVYYNAPHIKVTLLNQDPDPVNAGEVVEVRFKIENKGTETLEDVIVKIFPIYPFSLYSGTETRNIGKLIASQTGADAMIVDYKLRVDEDAVEGDNEIKLQVSYSGMGTVGIMEEDLMIDVEVEEVNFQFGSLQTEPVRLVSDTEDAELSVELQNIGDDKAKNVITKLILPGGFKASYGYSDVSNLGTIDAESSKTATFYVDVNKTLKEGEYKAILNIKYRGADDQDNKYKEKNLSLMIPLKATPLFEITDIKTIPEKIRAGDDVELRFKVKNTGTKDAESVSVRAFKESSQPFDFYEKSDYVGRLAPNDEGEAVLYFSIKKDAIAKTYILDIEIRTINKEDVLLFEKTVPIKISNHGKFSFARKISSEMIILVMIIMLGVMGVFVWKKLKKRNKK